MSQRFGEKRPQGNREGELLRERSSVPFIEGWYHSYGTTDPLLSFSWCMTSDRTIFGAPRLSGSALALSLAQGAGHGQRGPYRSSRPSPAPSPSSPVRFETRKVTV